MRQALKSLFRMRTITFLMIIQLSLSLALINNITFLKDYSENKSEKLRELFNIESTYLIRIQNKEYSRDTMNGYSILDEVVDGVSTLKDSRNIRNVYTYGFPYSFFVNISDEFSKDPTSAGILIDKNFLSRKTISVDEGRTFTNDDFDIDYKTHNIPILLGSKLKSVTSVGQVYPSSEIKEIDENYDQTYDDINFEVIGFIKENELIAINDKEDFSAGSRFTNSIYVIPVVKDFYSYSPAVTLGDFGMFFELSPSGDIDKAKEDIKRILTPYNEKYNLQLDIKSAISLNNSIGITSIGLDRDSIITKVLAIILTVIAVTGIVTIMLGEIKKRKREFGIKLCNGASLYTLGNEIFLEFLLICTISSIISFVINGYINKRSIFSVSILIGNGAYVIVLAIIMSIIPLIKIRRMKVIDLIRGK